MGKKITINEEETIEANDAFYKMLRGGEGGTMADTLGAEWQAFLGKLATAADKKGAAVKGGFTISYTVVTGSSGDHRIVMETKMKTPKIARRESVIFTDPEGVQTSGPVTRQHDLPFSTPAVKAISRPGAMASGRRCRTTRC